MSTFRSWLAGASSHHMSDEEEDESEHRIALSSSVGPAAAPQVAIQEPAPAYLRSAVARRRAKSPPLESGYLTGPFTAEENARFVEALELYGRDWDAVTAHLGTRPKLIVRSKAQKHFIKLYLENKPLPAKVAESGTGYTMSGKPLVAASSRTLKAYTGTWEPGECPEGWERARKRRTPVGSAGSRRSSAGRRNGRRRRRRTFSDDDEDTDDDDDDDDDDDEEDEEDDFYDEENEHSKKEEGMENAASKAAAPTDAATRPPPRRRRKPLHPRRCGQDPNTDLLAAPIMREDDARAAAALFAAPPRSAPLLPMFD